MLYKASAPGSLMLLGEYAVLHKQPALVCAVDKRMTVTLRPRQDKQINIVSPRLGQWKTELSQLVVAAPFHFVTACLYQHRKKLKSGFDLEIEAEFSDQVGLGSSAAVTVATLTVLFAWFEIPLTSLQLIREARRIIRAVQGVGSGADVAACVLGGIVAYRAAPLQAEKFSLNLPLTVIYSGSKTTTVEAIKRVQQQFSAAPALFEKICVAISHCVKEGVLALRENNWDRLGKAMNVQQGLMQALGVSTPLLDGLLAHLRGLPGMLGAKISGSGLGDCVIGLGEMNQALVMEDKESGVRELQVRVAEEGVKLSPLEKGGLRGI